MAKAKPVTNLDPQAPLQANVCKIARVRLEELYSWESYVDYPYAIHELHNLRIAAKRLRYTLELFQDALQGKCDSLIQEMVQLQEELGALHDSDVIIALLRLCLGSQTAGTGYQQALARLSRRRKKGTFFLNPDMLAALLNSDAPLSADQRKGLELFLQYGQQRREEQYLAFRQHWQQLQARDFYREVISLLDSVVEGTV
ncbi:MAG: CHAD domain-containing protein [Ktedonobacteraceae bacterium]|nr:CHAD domain-containing protein [Ktedonobacteraceae bacterium]